MTFDQWRNWRGARGDPSPWKATCKNCAPFS